MGGASTQLSKSPPLSPLSPRKLAISNLHSLWAREERRGRGGRRGYRISQIPPIPSPCFFSPVRIMKWGRAQKWQRTRKAERVRREIGGCRGKIAQISAMFPMRPAAMGGNGLFPSMPQAALAAAMASQVRVLPHSHYT